MIVAVIIGVLISLEMLKQSHEIVVAMDEAILTALETE